MIIVLTTFTAKDDASAHQLAALLMGLATTAPAEPGNQGYQVFAADAEPRVFYVLDRWESQQALDQHVQLLRQQGVLDRAAPLLAKPMATARLVAK